MLREQGVQAKASALGGQVRRALPTFLEENSSDLLITGRCREEAIVGILGLHRDLLGPVGRSPLADRQ